MVCLMQETFGALTAPGAARGWQCHMAWLLTKLQVSHCLLVALLLPVMLLGPLGHQRVRAHLVST